MELVECVALHVCCSVTVDLHSSQTSERKWEKIINIHGKMCM